MGEDQRRALKEGRCGQRHTRHQRPEQRHMYLIAVVVNGALINKQEPDRIKRGQDGAQKGDPHKI